MVTLSQEMLNVQNAADCIRMYQLKELTLKKGEDMFQKLSTVYYSSMAQGCSLAVMIDVPEENVGANIYLGIREDPSKKNMKSHNLDTSSKTLQKVLRSNFPGSETRGISLQEEEELLDGAFGDAQEAVASVSCVAALRDKSKTEDKAFVQGIERFMDAMDGEVYTAMFLAEPVSVDTQAEIRSGYENLYSSLSPFRKSTWSYTENQSTAVMESLCSGTSHTISDTVSTTTTDGTNQSSSVTDGAQKMKGVSGGINGGIGSSSGTSVTKVSPVAGGIAGILGLGSIAASALIPSAGAVIGPLLGTAGRAVGGTAPSRTAFNSIARNIGDSMGLNASWGTSHSTTEQTGTSHSTSNGTSHGISDSTSQQESYGTTDTRGTGRTQQVELCNKSVEELLERIESQLKRAKESEDYNILRRTSTEQSEEGSNLAGKSVEMIANAIAEMRTYGEGFIIADQSPSAVDISAIRNTNTKIIMRLPDEQDRELAGKAAALKDEQLDEIARFPKGVAVVYQNDWMEPVLCKVSKFDTEEQPDVLKKKSTIVSRKNEEQLLLRNLLKKEEGEALELNLQQLKERVLRLTLPTKTKIAALKALQKNGRCAPKDIQGVVYDLICTPMVEKDLDDAESLEEWRDEIIYSENAELSELSEEVQDKVCELILRERIKRFNQPEEYLTQWEEFCKRRVLE